MHISDWNEAYDKDEGDSFPSLPAMQCVLDFLVVRQQQQSSQAYVADR